MTSSQLDAIRARVRHASDGPWSVRRIPNSFPSQAGDRYTHPCVRGFRVPRRIYDLAWQQVRWRDGFLDGLLDAQAADKPLFFWFYGGDPLGNC